MAFDFLYVLQTLRTPLFDNLMVFITHTGDGGLIWIAVALGFCLSKKYRRCGITMLLALAAGALIGNVLLKNIIARPRPCWVDQSIILLIENPKDFSFPSGHTLAAFGAATTVFLSHKIEGLILLFWASLTAFSRLYLFVHYLSDVLASIVLGVLIAFIATYWATLYLPQKKSTD
jgi:undecaprenyl-diphosphatase